MARRVLAGGLLAVAGTLACAVPAAADWLDAESRLTAADGTQQWPALSGRWLVYAADPDPDASAGYEIRVQDLTTGEERALTPKPTATGAPAVSGDRVVWADAGDGAPAGLWLADLATGGRRRLDAPAGTDPAISGPRVCYTDAGRIRVHDVRTGSDRAVSPPGAGAANCDISGTIVVWQDQRDSGADIFALDLATGLRTRVTSDPSDQVSPRVDGRLVVWQDHRTGDADIHALNLTTRTERQLSAAPGAQLAPDVSGGRVVWADERFGHGNTEVYLLDIASGVETRVTRDDGWSAEAAIDGDRVAYTDARGARQGLYGRQVAAPVLRVAPGTDGDPGLAGQLTGEDGVPVVAAELVLQASADGATWQDAGSGTTAGDGSFGLPLPQPFAGTWLRVRFAGSRDFAPADSEPVRVDALR